jgi:hypothetical protein
LMLSNIFVSKFEITTTFFSSYFSSWWFFAKQYSFKTS